MLVLVVSFAVFVGVVVLLDAATRPAKPARPCRGGAPRSLGDDGGDGEERCCCCVFLVSGVASQDVFVVPFSPSSSSSSLITNLSLLAPAPFLFEKRDRTRAAPIAFRHRARGSKFSRRPERSCSVGEAKVVSHGCARACSAVRRRTGSGFIRARMKPFAVCAYGSSLSVCGGWNAHMTKPSSDTFFQYRSWKLILASVVCRTSSFMSSDRKGVYPQRSM